MNYLPHRMALVISALVFATIRPERDLFGDTLMTAFVVIYFILMYKDYKDIFK